MKKKYMIKVLQCDYIENTYRLRYLSEEALPYKKYDRIIVKDAENNIHSITINKLTKNTLNIFMNAQYKNSIMGDITMELLFSPLTSIEGALEIMRITQVFPSCHYDEVIAYQEENNHVSLLIHLKYFHRTMKLVLFDVQESQFIDYQMNNVMIQLDFWYHTDGIEVEIDSMEGLNGTLICKRVKAEWID